MENKIRRIGILTSGGDAPGMNAAIRAVVRTCVLHDVIPVGIHRGYNGLIHSDVVELDARAVNGITSRGGTILYTARSEEFRTDAGVKQAADNCRYLGIDGVIAIGGDGTFRGARELSKYGINTIGIPGTIDNDIACSHYSIGFDTAANTAIEAIDKLSKAKNINDSDYTVLNYLAHAYRLSGDTDNAISVFQEIIDKFPGTQKATKAEQQIEALGGTVKTEE